MRGALECHARPYAVSDKSHRWPGADKTALASDEAAVFTEAEEGQVKLRRGIAVVALTPKALK